MLNIAILELGEIFGSTLMSLGMSTNSEFNYDWHRHTVHEIKMWPSVKEWHPNDLSQPSMVIFFPI